MNEQEIREIVSAAATEEDGTMKLPCAKAFHVAKEHGIALRDIGRTCNEEKIRICKCQLGCFE